MKDSVETIKKRGRSSILHKLANPSGDSSSDSSSSTGLTSEDEVITKEAIIHYGDELTELSHSLEVISIESRCCNERDLVGMDFSSVRNLRKLIVGDECCANVEEVVLVGLSMLERVEFGNQCCSEATGGLFEVMECEKLRSVVIGDGSFGSMQLAAFVSESLSSL